MEGFLLVPKLLLSNALVLEAPLPCAGAGKEPPKSLRAGEGEEVFVVAALDDGQPRFSKLDEEDAPRLGLMERAQLVDGLHLHGLLVLQAEFAGFGGGEIRVGARDAEAAEEAFAPAGGALCR